MITVFILVNPFSNSCTCLYFHSRFFVWFVTLAYVRNNSVDADISLGKSNSSNEMTCTKSMTYFACKPGKSWNLHEGKCCFAGQMEKQESQCRWRRSWEEEQGKKWTGTGTFSPVDSWVIKKIRVNYRAGGLAGLVMKPDLLSWERVGGWVQVKAESKNKSS